jgi:hypothetical protein
MKQIYFGAVAIILLLVQGNRAGGQPTDHYSKLNTNAVLFIENKGQIKDQYKNPRTDIDFVLHGNGLNIFISAGHISYQFIKSNNSKESAQKLKEYNDSKFTFTKAYTSLSNQSYTLYRLDMELSGANINSAPQTGTPLVSKFNYYLSGSDGITQVNSYDHITYKDIYPGIDWVVYIKNNELKYDFIIQEGSLPENIKIQYKGATKQELTKEGRLNITTPLGAITEEAPIAWTASDHKNIAVAFESKNNAWGFKTDSWKGTLILDPGLSWSTYYGGSGMEVAKDIYTYNGSVYLTGLTTSLNQIATTGTYQTNYYGGAEGDAFLARFSGDGALIWATYYGGDSNDLGWSIVADPMGNVYMAGYTESGVGIATGGSHQPVFGSGTTDAFLAKFSATGQRVWSTYYGGSNPDYGHAIAIDGAYLYMCGLTYSNTGMSTIGSYQPVLTSYGGNTGNAFLVKWDTAGHRQWSTYYGAGTTSGSSVVVDQNHDIYLTGGTNAPADISTAGSHQNSYGGFLDNYLAKFNASGQRQWATYFGGTAAESTFPVALVGDHNNIYLAGITYSYSQIATPGTSRPVYSFGIDGYLASFTAAGVQEWGTYVGPGNVTNGVYVSDIALGNCGDIYLTGDIFPSVGLNPTEDAYQQTAGGGTFDGALIRYNPQGKSTYCSYIGGAAEDNMSAIAMDKDENLYLTGMTASDSNIATTGTHQSTFAGIKDAFLMKFLDVFIGDKENPNGIFDSVRCINDTFPVPYMVTAPFKTGNVFTAELSDNSGSFANPTAIGTYAATTNGTIHCFIPQTVTPGNGYRLRISGSLPATKGSCSVPLFLNLPPIPEITVYGDTLISSAAANYQWIKNGASLSGATNQKLITNVSGWYKVSVTDPVTGCTSYSDSVAVGNVGIDQLPDIRSLIRVYPNPFDEQIQVTLASSLAYVQSYTLTISTPLGKKIKTLTGLQYKNKIDLTEVTGGIYFMEINGPAGKGVFKIVKRF